MNQLPAAGNAADGKGSPWVRYLRPQPRARIRVYCFPFAGAGAAVYRPWADAAPASLEIVGVQLPGRQDRYAEPLLTDTGRLVPALARAIELDAAGRPFAFFGHSLGAILAFEASRELRRRGATAPAYLAVSGQPAPHAAVDRPAFHLLPDDQFLGAIRDLGGLAPELGDHEEFMRIILPVLRADFTVAETYRYRPEIPLNCPIMAFGGCEDDLAPVAAVRAWPELTAGTATVRFYPGGHFFLWPHSKAIVAALGSAPVLPHYSG